MTWRVIRRASIVPIVIVTGWLLHGAGRALVVEAPIEDPDAIVMLASHEWERLPAAAALARQYPSARMILTVPEHPSYWNCFRCGERVAWLRREGIDPRRVVELAGPRNTFEESQTVARYVRANGIDSLAIVTSPYHTRRSLATFRSALSGSDVQTGIVPAASNATPDIWWRYDADRSYVAYEWTAIAAYALRHRILPF